MQIGGNYLAYDTPIKCPVPDVATTRNAVSVLEHLKQALQIMLCGNTS